MLTSHALYLQRWNIKCSALSNLQRNFVPFFTQYDLHMKQTLVSHFFQQLAKILDMFSAWKVMTYHCPTWWTQKRMLSQSLSRRILFTHCHARKCLFQMYNSKEYFSISPIPNFFLTVQNECILLCLNGMSKAAIPRCNTVHFFCAPSAFFRCTVTSISVH